jgi:hypothetical protein
LLSGLAECGLKMEEIENLKIVGDDTRAFVAAMVELDREEICFSDLRCDPEDVDCFDCVVQP